MRHHPFLIAWLVYAGGCIFSLLMFAAKTKRSAIDDMPAFALVIGWPFVFVMCVCTLALSCLCWIFGGPDVWFEDEHAAY